DPRAAEPLACRRRVRWCARRRDRRSDSVSDQPLRPVVQERLWTGERRRKRQRLGAAWPIAVQAPRQLAAAAARAPEPHRRACRLVGRVCDEVQPQRSRRIRPPERELLQHMRGLQCQRPAEQRPVRDSRQHQRLYQAQGRRTDRKVHTPLRQHRTHPGSCGYGTAAWPYGTPPFWNDFVQAPANAGRDAGGIPSTQSPYEPLTKAYAAFAQVEYRLNALLGLTVGARVTSDKKDFQFT